MKMKFILLGVILLFSGMNARAQNADEIIDTYLENIGGRDNWNKVERLVINAKVNQQGMEIPITIIQQADGKQLIKINLQGKEVVQLAFNGETAWGENFMTMQPEKADNEATENLKRESGDFPNPFLHYKENGYKVEYIGEESREGVDCYKIKLTKKPQLINGEEVENVDYYFFDKENYVPIVVEKEIKEGEMAGKIGISTFSDYEEVDGLFFAFSMAQGIKDMYSQPVEILSIKVNPEIDEAIFNFPEVIETPAPVQEGK